VLCRESSAGKFEALRARFAGAEGRLLPVWGDIIEPGVISAADRDRLAGTVDHLFNLAAVYDMAMDEDTGDRVNVAGAANVVELANALGGAITLHQVSSVAVAGDSFSGRFSEAMFDEGQRFTHPYYRTKFASEGVVRTRSTVPYRIYRPGIVVGSSRTGEMDKIDGPYYFFDAIRRIRGRIPAWMPVLAPSGGLAPVVPVDYVAAAIDAIAHKPGLDGGCFHLLQTPSPTVGDMIGLLLRAAGGPQVQRTFDVPFYAGGAGLFQAARRLIRLAPVDVNKLLSDAIGMPVSALVYSINRTIFDDSQARRALQGTGVSCPDLSSYVDKLWEYWELHLARTPVPSGLPAAVNGKVVLVTGASSGIGHATTRTVAAAGARAVLVARTKEKLDELAELIEADGGEAYVYPCDLSDMDAIDAMADKVLGDIGPVDVLVNNAGRSIRRGVLESLDRFHDVERTMQLNYFGAVRLIHRLLPAMVERQSGHIINISSVGVQANAPRFSAYVASKAALDAYGRCISAELRDQGVHLTTVYMPLVRTPMIAPTAIYRYFPAWLPDDAAAAVCKAMVDRPKTVATPIGRAAAISYALWPKVNDAVLNRGYKLFPTSARAKAGGAVDDERPTMEQLVFSSIFRGEHW
jgi:NAD(P)-dependent dehydrogenase (short-subunit alcohol dehydrogenase family)/thioester reductase-like protein